MFLWDGLSKACHSNLDMRFPSEWHAFGACFLSRLLCFISLKLLTLLVVLNFTYIWDIHANSTGFLHFYLSVAGRDISSMPSLLLFQFDWGKRDVFATSFINIVPRFPAPISPFHTRWPLLYCHSIAIPFGMTGNNFGSVQLHFSGYAHLPTGGNFFGSFSILLYGFVPYFFLPARFQFAFYWRTGVVHLLSFSFGFSHKSIGNAF